MQVLDWNVLEKRPGWRITVQSWYDLEAMGVHSLRMDRISWLELLLKFGMSKRKIYELFSKLEVDVPE